MCRTKVLRLDKHYPPAPAIVEDLGRRINTGISQIKSDPGVFEGFDNHCREDWVLAS